MSAEIKPTLAFPHCWLQGDTISAIFCSYKGPSLENSEVVLLFSDGQRLSSTDPDQIVKTQGETVEDWDIEVKQFDPGTAGTIGYEMFILYQDPLIPLTRATLYKGTWEIKPRLPESL